MPDYITETRTFVGEADSQPGSGYAGYIVGQQYQVRVMRLADGSVEVTSTCPHTHRAFVSVPLFERWWKLVPVRAGDSGERGAV